MLQRLGLMVRDARHCCAPHREGLQLTRLLETSSRGGATAASKD